MPVSPGSVAPASSSSNGGDTFTKAVLAADFPKTNNTLANVTGFAFNVLAGETWLCNFNLAIESGGVVDFKLDITGPTSSLFTLFALENANVAVLTPYRVTAVSTAIESSGVPSPGGYALTLAIIATADGTCQLRFAQKTTDAAASKILAGSTMVAHKV